MINQNRLRRVFLSPYIGTLLCCCDDRMVQIEKYLLLSIYIAAISVQETKADGQDQPLDIISQNLEFLQAVGFPRQSCRCGGGHHAYDLVRSPNTSLIGFYHTFEQDHQIYNRVMAEQMSFIESSGLMDIIPFIRAQKTTE